MYTIHNAYETLIQHFKDTTKISVGSLFGKACLKIHGKAFVAQQYDFIAFKLPQAARQFALSLEHAGLWDPSGKGRPMKEWVTLPAMHQTHFLELAKQALVFTHPHP
jgi:hypothetical protein